MLFDLFGKKNSVQPEIKKASSSKSHLDFVPFSFSWVLTGKLAVGSMPRTSEDWLLLEGSGLRKRFSCCYAEENIFVPIPPDWQSKEVALPDHRAQEELTIEKLVYALNEIIRLMTEEAGPIYLHCFAGQERSCLLAVGTVCLTENKDLFDGLAWVRQCHKRARPLYHHLDILEKALDVMR